MEKERMKRENIILILNNQQNKEITTLYRLEMNQIISFPN
jgi:hypothetical protein